MKRTELLLAVGTLGLWKLARGQKKAKSIGADAMPATEETAALGGTRLLLDAKRASRFSGVNQSLQGRAYRR
jgi:hypothetical protein